MIDRTTTTLGQGGPGYLAMKGYSTLNRVPALEPHNLTPFNILSKTSLAQSTGAVEYTDSFSAEG